MSKPRQPKSKSSEAKALAHPLFRQRVVKSAKAYTRKGRAAREGRPSAFTAQPMGKIQKLTFR